MYIYIIYIIRMKFVINEHAYFGPFPFPLLVGYFCPFPSGKFEVAVATTSLENEGNCQGKPRDIFGHIWSPKFGISRSVYIDMNRYFIVKDWFTLPFLVLYHHLVYHYP